MTDATAATINNPLLAFALSPHHYRGTNEGLPPFLAIDASHVVPAMNALLEQAERAFVALEEHVQPTWASVVDKLNDTFEPLERAWGVVGHLVGTKNTPELRSAHEEMQPKVVDLMLRVAQSEPLFAALNQLQRSDAAKALSAERQRILQAKLLDAKLAGIGLAPDDKATFLKIESELSTLSTTFSNHVLDETKAFSWIVTDSSLLVGVPASAKAMLAHNARQNGHADASAELGPYCLTLDFPSFDPVMRFCERREVREKLYRAYVTRASDLSADQTKNNLPLIDRILELRQQKAMLLGFASFAELSLARKMAPSVSEVEHLLEDLRQRSLPKAKQELAELTSLAGFTLSPWDVGFYAERLREQRYGFSEEALRPYFALPRVLDGLFGLCQRLFGVVIRRAEAETWHSDVHFYEVCDETGANIAAFFLDPYARPGEKRPGAWMDDCVTRRRLPAGVRLPVAYLVCNGPPPVDGQPALLTFREVETLFHELGHGLQHMLTRVDDVDASGIRGIEWDAVELPSQFMENWCTHEHTLLSMAKHFETGETLPRDLFEKLRAQKTFRAASMMLRQINFARTDLVLHASTAGQPAVDVLATVKRVGESTSVMPPLPEDRFIASFLHIFAGGYSAGYYSYKWAEVLSADAFGAFEDAGVDDEQAVAQLGRRFRDTVLAEGGGAHPMEVFKRFRGRAPTTDALLRHAGML